VQDYYRVIKIASWSTGTVSGVRRKAPEEGHRTVGFQISGDGDCTAQKKAMKEKSILFGEATMSGTMWRSKSDMAYNYFYMSCLGYGTPATTLTKKDCEEIQRPVENKILPKMGISRCTEVRYIWESTVCRTGVKASHSTARTYNTTVPTVTRKIWRCEWAPHANNT
jgi:hypothetical protein